MPNAQSPTQKAVVLPALAVNYESTAAVLNATVTPSLAAHLNETYNQILSENKHERAAVSVTSSTPRLC